MRLCKLRICRMAGWRSVAQGARAAQEVAYSLSLRFRKSQSATVVSAEPVASVNSLYGLKERQLTSAECALIVCRGVAELTRVSQIIAVQSSEAEPNSESCKQCHWTSSTMPVCPLKIVFASNSLAVCHMGRGRGHLLG